MLLIHGKSGSVHAFDEEQRSQIMWTRELLQPRLLLLCSALRRIQFPGTFACWTETGPFAVLSEVGVGFGFRRHSLIPGGKGRFRRKSCAASWPGLDIHPQRSPEPFRLAMGNQGVDMGSLVAFSRQIWRSPTLLAGRLFVVSAESTVHSTWAEY